MSDARTIVAHVVSVVRDQERPLEEVADYTIQCADDETKLAILAEYGERDLSEPLPDLRQGWTSVLGQLACNALFGAASDAIRATPAPPAPPAPPASDARGIRHGARYDARLTTPQIAAKIRDEIKAAVKAGTLPKGLQCSVRSRRFAGGSAIDVEIKALPAGWQVHNPERLRADQENPHGPTPQIPRYSEATRALIATLEAMLAAYNFDGSDTQTDYFHVNFYEHVEFDGEIEAAARERELAALR